MHALEVGTMALGYLGTVNQSFTEIGSATSQIPGSIYFGGYDLTRVVGNISTQRGPFAGLEPIDDGKKGLIDLLDIEITMIEGSSPFNTTSRNNLLTHGNSSIVSTLSLPLLPEAPYLNLPRSTCDSIAAWLPVTYNVDLGLYLWNTLDPLYTRVLTSPSVLSFVFRKDQTNTQNITINVPFILLNLTLEPPLVKYPLAYFPCNAQSNGRYSLGRAFLQAAFVGANWNANNNQGVWWLAQATRPNISSQNNATIIHDQDTTISASSKSWANSWKGVWTPLIESSANSTGTAPPNSSNTTTISNGTSPGELSAGGLSAGAKLGIGAGVAVVGIVIISLFTFLYTQKRRKVQGEPVKEASPAGTSFTPVSGLVASPVSCYRDAGWGPVELTSEEVKTTAHEIDNHEFTPTGIGAPLYELGG